MIDTEAFVVHSVKWRYADAPVYKGNRNPAGSVKSEVLGLDVECKKCGRRWQASEAREAKPGTFVNNTIFAIHLRCANPSCDGSGNITKASLA